MGKIPGTQAAAAEKHFLIRWGQESSEAQLLVELHKSMPLEMPAANTWKAETPLPVPKKTGVAQSETQSTQKKSEHNQTFNEVRN